jgi:hypothetical protein
VVTEVVADAAAGEAAAVIVVTAEDMAADAIAN